MGCGKNDCECDGFWTDCSPNEPEYDREMAILIHEARHSLMDSIHETESEEELVDHITIHDLAQWDPTMVGRMLADKVQLDSGLSVQIVDCSSTVEFACFIEGQFVGNVDADGFTTEDLIDSPLYPKILEDLRAIFPMISE